MAVRGMKTGLGQFPFPIPLTAIPLTSALAASTYGGPECRAPLVVAWPRYVLALKVFYSVPADQSPHATAAWSERAGFFSMSHLRPLRQCIVVNQNSDQPGDDTGRLDPASVAGFTELVREHQAGLRAYIRALGVETDWVDDLAQEVFVLAFQKRERFENDKDFGKWLRGIARNLVANERRKTARRARILNGPLTDFLIESQPAVETSGESNMQQLVQAMNDCIAQLPERSRVLLQKRYEANENASTLSRLFNMSPEAIRQGLMRIRLWVKQCVESKAVGQ